MREREQPDSSAVAEQLRKLDAFLVDNQELESLNARLSAFNLFRVLRIERVEIRHSNVLAWLLTPNETHGLGATFVRRFLSRLLMENDQVDITPTPATIELMDFNDVEVLREWQNIDILVRSRANKWCLLIENKIGSKESKGQLLKYKAVVTHEMPDCQVIPVLLTLEGEEASEDGREAGYISLSHVQVLELAERIVEQNSARIPRDASAFLSHYLDTLRRLTMQDDSLIDLCKTIYRKHREAIDLIVEYGAVSQVMDAVESKISAAVDCEFVKPARGGLWFLPTEMAEHLPNVDLTGWHYLPRPVSVVWWFNYWKKLGRLGLVLEVGPMAEGPTRVRLLKAIREAGFSISERGLKLEAKFTRILSKYQKLRLNEDGEPDDNPEYIREMAGAIWKKQWEEGRKIVGVLKKFDWHQRAQ